MSEVAKSAGGSARGCLHAWEHDRSEELASASWHADDGDDMWALLRRVLLATMQQPSSIEPTSGRVNLYRPEGEGVASELWPLVDLADCECDEDRADPVPLTIHAAADGPPGPAGMRAWRISPDEARFEEHSPVYLDIVCEADDAPATLSLSVMSRLELWQPRSFAGREDVPGSVEMSRSFAMPSAGWRNARAAKR